ncbi:MAG: hypothetical protein OSB41_08960 [Kiritimatiellae bacterium]|nr:hypothetical protein [Kiritimatiellia bacterium]
MIEIPHVIGLVPTILLPLTLISVLVTTMATYAAVTVTKDAWYITDVQGTVRRLNPTLK